MTSLPPTTPCISCGSDLAGLKVVDGHSICPECKAQTRVTQQCGRCRYSLAGVPEIAARATCPECGHINVTRGLVPSKPGLVRWTAGEFLMVTSPIWLVFLSMALSSESRLVPLALLGGFVLPLAYFTLTSLHQIHFSGGTRRRPRMVYAAWITLEIGMALLMSCMAGLAG